jgi:hypothetical protein
VDICAQANVICQVITDVIRVIVDHDLIRIPSPVVAETNVVLSHAEVETAEPEAAWASSSQPPDVPWAEASPKMSMFPGTIEVIVRIATAGIVANPLAVLVDVGRLRVPGAIAEMPVLFRGMGRLHPPRPVRRWRVHGSATVLLVLLVLRKCKERCSQGQREYRENFLHPESSKSDCTPHP